MSNPHPNGASRQWWSQYKGLRLGPCDSREKAAQQLFDAVPACKEAMTGYGTFGPSFDIQWIKRENGDG